ncbi:MAG: peptide chain release factor N(5)-glutamine methyltransferase [Vulcanimicrobiaceae bacterium]
MTVGEALAHGRERLAAHEDDGRFDALRLLEETLARNAAWIFAHADAALEPEADERYAAAIERRAGGEPVAYIVGSAGFYGRSFAVTDAVLVPRPETEFIVALACQALRDGALPAPQVCDLGTGSGILAITLACELPGARVVASDISADALAVAAGNAATHGVAERVCFARGDVFGAVADGVAFDCVVANLPYIRSGDLEPVPAGLRFEPRLALDGGGDGLDAYRTLLAAAPARLKPGGLMLLEAGGDTTVALAELAAFAFGARGCVHVHRDYAGCPRVVDIRT